MKQPVFAHPEQVANTRKGKGFAFMKTINIGDVTVPIVGMGTWYLGEGNAEQSARETQALKVIVLIHYRLCFAVSMAIIDEIMQAHQT